MSTESNRSGVMLVRAWVHDGQVVARLQSSLSGEADHSAQITVGFSQIEERMHEWLREVADTPQ
ncbi:hypothetical protein [Arthrobacter sp. Leaf337]|uniref:hypothetical protein n=1 Tax=Arthrobacter sp. Leaf337 TaxID=1736342 RepID=UPI0012E15F2B|nr:hypothetical protein [Arthrobacter sp. Leaf337]